MWSGGVRESGWRGAMMSQNQHIMRSRFASFLFCAIAVVSIIAGSLTPRHNRGFLY